MMNMVIFFVMTLMLKWWLKEQKWSGGCSCVSDDGKQPKAKICKNKKEGDKVKSKKRKATKDIYDYNTNKKTEANEESTSQASLSASKTSGDSLEANFVIDNDDNSNDDNYQKKKQKKKKSKKHRKY